MNTNTGEIAAPAFLDDLSAQDRNKYAKPVKRENIVEPYGSELDRTGHTRISKNTPCPCGSGKRFQRCCKRRT